jgi:hypothetical protein
MCILACHSRTSVKSPFGFPRHLQCSRGGDRVIEGLRFISGPLGFCRRHMAQEVSSFRSIISYCLLV